MGITIELPCDIGDSIYEIVIDERSKEAYLDQYVVQDVSIKAIKYCDEWKDRTDIGTKIFLDRDIAKETFENMKSLDEYSDFKFFEFTNNIE